MEWVKKLNSDILKFVQYLNNQRLIYFHVDSRYITTHSFQKLKTQCEIKGTSHQKRI